MLQGACGGGDGKGVCLLRLRKESAGRAAAADGGESKRGPGHDQEQLEVSALQVGENPSAYGEWEQKNRPEDRRAGPSRRRRREV